MKRWLCIALLTFAGAAHGFEAPLTYARGQVGVVLHNPANGTTNNVVFDTEIRAAESMTNNPGWHSFAGLDENKAAMLLYAAPTIVSVKPVNDYAAQDILFVDAYGVIHEIMPSLVPANLEASISSKEPMIAVLYLKSGTCSQLGIRPGDQVTYGTFRKRPVILDSADDAPEHPAPAAPAVPTPLLNNAAPATATAPLLNPVQSATPLVNPVPSAPVTTPALNTAPAASASSSSSSSSSASSSGGALHDDLIDRLFKQHGVQ